MARPRKERELKNTHRITIRLADIDMELLDQVTKRAKCSRAEYIRDLIRGNPVRERIYIQVTDDVLSTFAKSIYMIGISLNHIEKYFNTGGNRSLAMQDAIHHCINELIMLRKKFLDYAYDIKKR